MANIIDTVRKIDQRVAYYHRLLLRLVRAYETEPSKTNRADFLLKTALRVAFLYDYYYETRRKQYLQAANKYKQLLYSHCSLSLQNDLKWIERRIIKLFSFERKIWQQATKGQPVSNQDILKFWKMKSADAKFYGRIVNEFIKTKNFTKPIYVYTLLQDIYLDISEYDRDYQANMPNLLCLKLSQHNEDFPSRRKKALELLHKYNDCVWFKKCIASMLKSISSYNFGRCSCFKKIIRAKYKQVQKQIGIC